MTLNHVTVNCACGAVIGSHYCTLVFPPTDPQAPTYTLDAIERALRPAMGGAVPHWVWDDFIARLGTIPADR